MNQRPLALTGLRTFEAVARRLSFSGAADELHLTQSAVSRQIQALETELGAPLFSRATRRVELTVAGQALAAAVVPALARIDAAVTELRHHRARRHLTVSTYASFATSWLLPRLAGFQQQHPDIDIRISTQDHLIALDEPDVDVALRHHFDATVPPGGERLFGSVLTPVVGPLTAQGGPPLTQPADLAQHTLIEPDDPRDLVGRYGWGYWLAAQGLPGLMPKRWLYLHYTHQQVQAAAAGQGVALAPLALVHQTLARGELVEPFGAAGRLRLPGAYWLVLLPGARLRPELRAFAQWLRDEAAQTRAQIDADGA